MKQAAPALAGPTAGLIDDTPLAGASVLTGAEAAAAPRATATTGHVGRKASDSLAQVVGRLLIAALRVVVAGIVIRAAGRALFGEYSVILVLGAVGDCLADFGTTEIFVREACREPGRREHLFRILAAMKLIQVPVAIAVLVTIMLAMRYPAHMVLAGVVGCANLLFFGLTLVYRAAFRTDLTMEREALAELISVVVLVPLIALTCHLGGGLVALVACQLASEVVFMVGAWAMGRGQFRPSIHGVSRADIAWGFRSTAVVGVVALLVAGYETIDILMLSKFALFSDLALYSGAQRLVVPALLALAAVATSFYPLMASYWPADKERFGVACQRGLNAVLFLAGGAACTFWAGSRFFMGALSGNLIEGAPALRVIALLCFVKAISTTLGPVLYVVRAQKQALYFVAAASVCKLVVMAAVIPRYGYMGAAIAAVVVEAICAAVPAVLLVKKYSGYAVRWAVPAKMTLSTAVAALVPHWLAPADGLPAAAIAPVLFVALILATGAVRPAELRVLLSRKPL